MAEEWSMPDMTQSYVSSNFIRDKTSPSNVSRDYESYNNNDDRFINNTPATLVVVRLNPCSSKFELNGKIAPRLLLTKNKKYQFNVVTHDQPFCLMDVDMKPMTPLSTYTVFGFTATNDTPVEFYYGTPGNSKNLGKVKVV
jgi:hypothetical protein